MAARFKVPDGWTVQAFAFALDCTVGQEACLRRQFGGRRYARNWAVRTLKEDITAYRETGEETEAPSLAGLRKRWNQAKDAECTDAGTGEVWWPQISKEAFADGIKAAVGAYWNWQSSRAGTRRGRRAGFPRFAKKGRDRDRVTFTVGAIRVEPDRRHVTLPRIGTVRTCENTRRLERLPAKGRARIPAVTVSRKGTRLVAAFRALVQRPQQAGVADPGSRAGVDVGVRVLATVANDHGEVIERVPNPRPLEAALKELRHLSRERSRRTRGSRRYRETRQKIPATRAVMEHVDPYEGIDWQGVEESLISGIWQLPDGRTVSELFAEGWPGIQRTVRDALRKWRRFEEDLLSPDAMFRLLTVARSTSYTRHWWGQGRWAAICKAIVTDATAAGISLPAPYNATGADAFLRDLQEPDAISDEALAWLIDISGAGPDGPRGLRSHSATNPIIREFELYVSAASDQPVANDSEEAL